MGVAYGIAFGRILKIMPIIETRNKKRETRLDCDSPKVVEF